MGQYYRIYTRNPLGVEQIFDNKVYFQDGPLPDWATKYRPEEDNKGKYFGTGSKLMEQSWMGFRATTAFTYYLYAHHPIHVVWCGDYAEPEECKELGFNYERVWGDYDTNTEPQFSKLCYPPAEQEKNFDKMKYFINVSKKLYLDLNKYKKTNTVDDECIYPISLLTALGNGRGGGDYWEEYPCFHRVGTWAGDLVSVEETIPEGYEEFTVRFREEKEPEE